MGKIAQRRPRGIRILIIAEEVDYIRSPDYIRKTGSRIVRIGGFSIFDCRNYQVENELLKVRPAICIVPNEKIHKEIERLAKGCEIIVSQFMHLGNERNGIMDQLEAQLRDYKSRS